MARTPTPEEAEQQELRRRKLLKKLHRLEGHHAVSYHDYLRSGARICVRGPIEVGTNSIVVHSANIDVILDIHNISRVDVDRHEIYVKSPRELEMERGDIIGF